MAYYELEPFGDLIADHRHGAVSALMANLKRDPKSRPDPYRSDDFIYWRDTGAGVPDDEPVLLANPVAQGQLLRAALFGVRPSS